MTNTQEAQENADSLLYQWAAQVIEAMAKDPRCQDQETNEYHDAKAEIIDNLIPASEEVWQLFISNPELRTLDPPGGMADSLEGVLRDAITNEIWQRINVLQELDSVNGDVEEN